MSVLRAGAFSSNVIKCSSNAIMSFRAINKPPPPNEHTKGKEEKRDILVQDAALAHPPRTGTPAHPSPLLERPLFLPIYGRSIGQSPSRVPSMRADLTHIVFYILYRDSISPSSQASKVQHKVHFSGELSLIRKRHSLFPPGLRGASP